MALAYGFSLASESRTGARPIFLVNLDLSLQAIDFVSDITTHIAQVRNIKEKFDVDVQFSIIEDLSMSAASAYEIIQPAASDTSAVRATFLIDPEGVLQALVYYPMSNSRSVDEFLLLLTSLQTSDQHGVATSENWQRDEQVIVPPPQTAQDADKRVHEDYACVDWYFFKKDIAD